MIYMIFLITKNGLGSANYIILLIRLNEKYRDANNNSILDPTLGDIFQCFDINKPKAPVAKPLATLLAAASTTPTSEVSNVSSV